jgi:hypothetical protein
MSESPTLMHDNMVKTTKKKVRIPPEKKFWQR